MIAWVIELPLDEVTRAAGLRHLPGVEIAFLGPSVWLRGNLTSEDPADLRKRMPGARIWRLETTGLIPIGKRLPERALPELPWQPLSACLDWRLPEALLRFPGNVTRVQVRLLPSSDERPVNLALYDWSAWSRFAATAPQWRLERWSFALNADDQIAIRGTPLPPLPGAYFVEQAGVALAAGWNFEPAVEIGLIRDGFGLDEGDIALVRPAIQTGEGDATHTAAGRGGVPFVWERVAASQWVQAARASIRRTSEERNERHL